MSLFRLRGRGRMFPLAVFILILGLTFSCTSSDTDVAGGGVGGTGIYTGVVSGFGSVFVNGVEFTTDEAEILVNDAPATEAALETGMKVEVEAKADRAVRVIFDPEILGPLGSVGNETLTVLGQTVFVDGTTVLKGFRHIQDLRLNDDLLVSGFFDADGNVRATFIELVSGQAVKREVKGLVTALDASGRVFTLKGLTVDYSGVGDPPPLRDGDFVEARGTLSGDTLVASEIEIEGPVTALPGYEMSVEGIVTTVYSREDFEINGVRVRVNGQTRFKNGSAGAVARNVRIEAEGKVDIWGVLEAEEVEFLSCEGKEVKIEGEVDGVDPVDSTLTVLGIRIKATGGTVVMDESDLQMRPFTLSDLRAGDFVEAGGFVNDMNDVVAVKIERIEPPESASLSGPIDRDSLVPPDSFSILGITIDVSAPGVSFADAEGNDISASAFFAAIKAGDIVDVTGTYSNDTMTATEVEIEKIN